MQQAMLSSSMLLLLAFALCYAEVYSWALILLLMLLSMTNVGKRGESR